MTEELKTALAVATATVSIVSAYWVARGTAAKETAEVAKDLATTKEAMAALGNSLDKIESLLSGVAANDKTNALEYRQLFIDITALKVKVRHLEEHYDVHKAGDCKN